MNVRARELRLIPKSLVATAPLLLGLTAVCYGQNEEAAETIVCEFRTFRWLIICLAFGIRGELSLS